MYDYAEEGYYFVTMCTKDRKCLFGSIREGRMELNGWGQIVRRFIRTTEKMRKNVRMYSYIVMPNHIHMIIQIKKHQDAVGARCARPQETETPLCIRQRPCISNGIQTSYDVAGTVGARSAPLRPPSLSIIINGIKSSCTSGIRKMMGNPSMQIWQRNYYERIVRNERELFDMAMYIERNPRNWEKDDLFVSF